MAIYCAGIFSILFCMQERHGSKQMRWEGLVATNLRKDTRETIYCMRIFRSLIQPKQATLISFDRFIRRTVTKTFFYRCRSPFVYAAIVATVTHTHTHHLLPSRVSGWEMPKNLFNSFELNTEFGRKLFCISFWLKLFDHCLLICLCVWVAVACMGA